MFTIDERIRGFPANREQVVALFQSINAPHLAIPGKQAGPAQGFILGLRSSGGFAVFVYLYLSETADCAVYASPRRNLSPEDYADEESEALGFVESMGFMMDNTNFRTVPSDQQDEMLKSLPIFQKEPRSAAATSKKVEAKTSPAVSLGKIFSAF